MANSFIEQGHSVQKVISYASIANSTWYQQSKKVEENGRKNNPGRPIPGYTVNPDGSIIPDGLIVSALENYRSRKEFANGGGYQKLSQYLRKDYNYKVNPKRFTAFARKIDCYCPKKRNRKSEKVR